MLKNILNLEGVKLLHKNTQLELNGGRNSKNPCYANGAPGGEIDPDGSACVVGDGIWFQGNCWVCW